MSARRVLLVAINYWPELTGIGKYVGEMAEWLVTRGFEVRVITAPPYYPAWKVNEGYSSKWYSIETISGVRVYRCPLWVPKYPSGVARVFHLATFALSSLPLMLWNALTWQPEIVFVVEPPFFCALGAWLSARIARAKAWLHIQDFEIDAAFQLGILRSELLWKFIRGYEKWLLRRFDRVSTISGRMCDKLQRKGIDKQRCFLFPNWVDTNQIRPLTKPNAFKLTLGIPVESLILLYSGNMGKKQGLEILIEVARLLQDQKNILLLLCGDGAVRSELMQMSKGLHNVFFIPLQPVEHFNELLNVADMHLLPQRADAEDIVMPSKLTAMLASGRPILAAARSGTEVANILSLCGIVVEPGDALGLKNAVLALAADEQKRKKLGAEGRKYAVEHLNQEEILRRAFGI